MDWSELENSSLSTVCKNVMTGRLLAQEFWKYSNVSHMGIIWPQLTLKPPFVIDRTQFIYADNKPETHRFYYFYSSRATFLT